MPDVPAGALVSSRPEPKKYPLPKIRPPRPLRGTMYRATHLESMWSWVLHRITGVGIFFFLLVHILDTSLIRVSPGAYNAVIGTYKTVIMGLGETVFVAAIGFHALNGLRIILIDFWSVGTKHPRLMFWIVIVLWILLLVGFVPRQLINVFSE